MAMTSKATAKELATLALAKALAEGDPKAAAIALKDGGDVDAFWIDGRTTLRELVGRRGSAAASKAMRGLFEPEAMKTLPPLKVDGSLWSKSFVEFVARRAYQFEGSTNPLSQGNLGTDLKGLSTAKAGVRLISNKWSRGIGNAVCNDSKDGKSSKWQIWFDAEWKKDRRIVGFWVSFKVDALGWTMVEEFNKAVKAGTESEWPPLTSPYVAAQRNWEGQVLAYGCLYGGSYNTGDLIEYLRNGGSPYATLGTGTIVGDPGRYEGTLETKEFMDALRTALGSSEGWHLRIAPLLTDDGIAALRAKVDLKLSTPKAKAPKKSLKDRTDIV